MLMFRVEWLETFPSCNLNLFKLVSLFFSFCIFTINFSSFLVSWYLYSFCFLNFEHPLVSKLFQSFLAGLAASGALTSALRLITKAAFENSKDGLRKGASRFNSPNSLLF